MRACAALPPASRRSAFRRPSPSRWTCRNGWSAQEEGREHHAGLVIVEGGAKPDISILSTEERIPWSGHSARYAIPDVYRQLVEHRTTLLFVNTRSQAEMLFQELWTVNDDNLPIALHHGSLDVAQRRKVEAAMAENRLRAVVATSTLDLGIDWGDVDLVIHVGAPKGASRLAQRIGRANHRMDEPSKAILVPANRFEVMECQAALDANYIGAQDTPPVGRGALDVLAQHVLGMACAEPFDMLELYDEVTSASPYADLTWETFERVVDFVATGGYALRTYERYARIRKTKEGRWRVSNPQVAQQYRLNLGTIVESPMLNIRMVKRGEGGRHRPRRRHARQGRGIFPRADVAGRYLHLLRQGAALRGHPRKRMPGLAGLLARSEDPLLQRRQVSAVDLSRRAGARDARRSRPLARACRIRCATGCRCRRTSRCCRSATSC